VLITAALMLLILFLIRPAENIQFESYVGGKEGFSAVPNIKAKTTTLSIPEKRINQEIAGKVHFEQSKGIGIKGLRLLTEDNYVTFEGNFIIYKNPVGITLGFKPRYQSSKVFLKLDTARLGLIKIPPKAFNSTINNITKWFGEDKGLGYIEATQELYIDLKNWGKNVDIKNVNIKKGLIEVEIYNI
jgi:uncharacterized protein YpmS